MPTAYLIFTSQGIPRTVPLEPETVCRIGRNFENTIVLDDRVVSRYHAAVIGVPGGEYQLTNLGSVNGTLLNGVLVNASVSLKDGDVIRIGDHEMRFEQDVASTVQINFDATRVHVVEETVSVLVVDLRDFTGLAQRLGENATSELVGAFLRESGKLLTEKGSWNTKFSGDAVMGVWRHESRTGAEAASEILSILGSVADIFDLVSGFQERFGLTEPVRAGAGINTGPAALGNMGSDAHADFTVIGDVVNKAFRLEAATRATATEVALGDATYKVLNEATELARVGCALSEVAECHPVQLKGYEGPQNAWCLSLSSLYSIVRAPRNMGASF